MKQFTPPPAPQMDMFKPTQVPLFPAMSPAPDHAIPTSAERKHWLLAKEKYPNRIIFVTGADKNNYNTYTFREDVTVLQQLLPDDFKVHYDPQLSQYIQMPNDRANSLYGQLRGKYGSMTGIAIISPLYSHE